MTATENTSNTSATSMLDPSGTLFDYADLNSSLSVLIVLFQSVAESTYAVLPEAGGHWRTC